MGGNERRYRFDDSYDEAVTLSDGQRVHLRLMQPSDKELLLAGFERLSPDSRYARFMAPKARLTEGELRYLTEVDGVDHFAMGAIRRHLMSPDEGDIRWFRSELLAENKASKRMMESLSPEVRFRASGDGALVATIPVPEPDSTPTEPGFFAGTAVQRLLAYVARATVTVSVPLPQTSAVPLLPDSLPSKTTSVSMPGVRMYQVSSGIRP